MTDKIIPQEYFGGAQGLVNVDGNQGDIEFFIHLMQDLIDIDGNQGDIEFAIHNAAIRIYEQCWQLSSFVGTHGRQMVPCGENGNGSAFGVCSRSH